MNIHENWFCLFDYLVDDSLMLFIQCSMISKASKLIPVIFVPFEKVSGSSDTVV